ncbi:MAG: serine hydrolase domain-containing protein [Chloroflexota bacterium]
MSTSAVWAGLNERIARTYQSVAPAVAVRVQHRGAVVFSGQWGHTDDSTSVGPNTLFDLASLTKLFTTTALLSLTCQQDISLQTPVVDLLPAFGEVAPRPVEGMQNPKTKAWQAVPAALDGVTVDPGDVTLWHLLTHSSGLAPWRDVHTFAAPDAPLSPTERWQFAVGWLVSCSFVDRVGAAVHYSDVGMMLLGEIVARLNRSSLETAVRQHVIEPLALRDVCYNPVRDGGISKARIAPTEFDRHWRKRRVWGEVHDENAFGVGGVAGHAGLFGSAEAVARFGQVWLDEAVPGIDADMRAQAISEQVRDGDVRRGLGWLLRGDQTDNERMNASAYGHTGFTGTSLWVDRARGLVVVILTNRVYYGRQDHNIRQFRRMVHDAVVAAVDAAPPP